MNILLINTDECAWSLLITGNPPTTLQVVWHLHFCRPITQYTIKLEAIHGPIGQYTIKLEAIHGPIGQYTIKLEGNDSGDWGTTCWDRGRLVPGQCRRAGADGWWVGDYIWQGIRFCLQNIGTSLYGVLKQGKWTNNNNNNNKNKPVDTPLDWAS